MKKLKSIATELGVIFLIMAILPVLISYNIANGIFDNSIQTESKDKLTQIANSAYLRIESYLNGMIADATTLAKLPMIKELLNADDIDKSAEEYLMSFAKEKGYYDILLIDRDGNINFTLKKESDLHKNISELESTELYKAINSANTLLQTEVSNFAYYPPSNTSAAFLAAPIFDNGIIVGNIALQIGNRELHDIINHFYGLGKSGEILVGSINEDRLSITAPTRHDAKIEGKEADKNKFTPLIKALNGESGSGKYIDYREKETLATWRYLPSLNWGMVVKIDTEEIYSPIKSFEKTTLYIALGSVLIALIGVFLSNRFIAAPIINLAKEVRSINEESLPSSLTITSRNEVQELIDAFNHLISSLSSYQDELEDRVSKRTVELECANEELEASNIELSTINKELADTLDELEKTQEQLVEKEKLAALGQLIAGVAHEINTPLGSISSSIDTISTAYANQANFLTLFASMEEKAKEEFLSLLRLGADGSELSFKEKRELKKEYEQKLLAYSGVDSKRVSDMLSHLPKIEIQDYIELLSDKDSSKIIEHLKSAINIYRSCQNIKVASEKAKKVVFALKNFSRIDKIGEKTSTNLRENIETVLTLYHNQMKNGVELNLELSELPPIMAYADELGQVWMNLVHNALQAMSYKGVLSISIKQDGNCAIVAIKDSGSGIPKEIQDKIFNPFFTTKPAGEGSGLGLDIVKKIVEKHNGKISFESIIGVGTTFFVSIPLKEENV